MRAAPFAALVILGVVLLAGSSLSASPAVERADVIGKYATVLRSYNAQLSAADARYWAERVLYLGGLWSLDPRLLVALVGAESSWDASARSPAGAIGLAQVMPGTADGLGVRVNDPLENLYGGALYLSRQLKDEAAIKSEDQRYRLALARYNAGPRAVQHHHIPPYPETIAYVQRVMNAWDHLKDVLPGAGGFPIVAQSQPTPKRVAAKPAPATPAPPVAELTMPPMPVVQIALAPPPRAERIPAVPGAFHVVVIDPERYSGEIPQSISSQVTNDLASKIATEFRVKVSVVSAESPLPADVAGAIARDNDAIIIAVPSYGGDARSNVSEEVQLVDRYGVFWGRASERKTLASSRVGTAPELLAAFDDLNDRAIDELGTRFQRDSDPSRFENLIRYALPLRTGERAAFFALVKAGSHLLVSRVDPFGTAAAAGLQVGDDVVRVNGRDASAMSDDDVRALFVDNDPAFRLDIRASDGSRRSVTFEQQDIRYYVLHREPLSAYRHL